jgi:hypothetical protein
LQFLALALFVSQLAVSMPKAEHHLIIDASNLANFSSLRKDCTQATAMKSMTV